MTAALVFASLAALANVAGGLLVVLSPTRSRRRLGVLVAFGAGFMLSVALLEMIPHGMRTENGLTAVLIGYLAVHLTQHTLTPHFHFGEETHDEAMVSRGIGVWALVGLLPHAFFDGVALASGFLETPELGTLIFGAVFLHKVPTGVSLASIVLASGNTVRQAVGAVVLVGIATILGAGLTPIIAVLAQFGLPFAAGVTIYVAASNLIPELHYESGWLIPGGVFLGVIVFYLARLAFPV